MRRAAGSRTGSRMQQEDVVASSADMQGWWRSPTTLKLLAYEYAKFVAMWARTRVEADPERSRVARIVGLAKPIKLVVQPLTR